MLEARFELTKEQMANLSKGLRELFDILNKKNNTTINSIVAKMATIDTGVVHLDIDDWMLKQMTENQDIFDKMLENNGWQTIKDRSVELRNIDNKKKMQDDAAAALALIFDLEGFAVEVKTNINFSNIEGNVSDKPSIMNRINVILSKYPCLSESDFIFETAYKSDKEDYWWVRYLINSTDIKGTQLYFIGKGGKLYDDIVAYNGVIQLEYNNTFNTNFPNCVSKSTNNKRLNVKTTKIPTNTIKH